MRVKERCRLIELVCSNREMSVGSLVGMSANEKERESILPLNAVGM